MFCIDKCESLVGRTVIRILLVALVVLPVVSLGGCPAPSKPGLPGKKTAAQDSVTVRRAKEAYHFKEWAGTVKVPGLIQKLQFIDDEFNRFGKVVIFSPQSTRSQCLNLNILSESFANVNVRITKLESVLAAHNGLILDFACHAMGGVNYTRVTEGPAAKIGDLFFLPKWKWRPLPDGAPVVKRLLFTRNNVLVILNQGQVGVDKYRDLVAIAKVIDSKLVKWVKSDPLQARIARLKEFYRFNKWAGKTKVSAKRIVALGIKPSDFTKYGSIRVYDPNLRLEIIPSPDRKIARVKVDMAIMPSAIEAHKGVLRYLASCTLPPPVFMKAEKEGQWDVGDVCFYLVRFPDRNVLFARNNVLVHLQGTSPEDTEMRIDVAALAKFIDKKLIASLVPVKQGEKQEKQGNNKGG